MAASDNSFSFPSYQFRQGPDASENAIPNFACGEIETIIS
jgi:hypothetical protein